MNFRNDTMPETTHNIITSPPGKIDLDIYRGTALRSLKVICENKFSLDFDKISQAILIKDELIQELYKSA